MIGDWILLWTVLRVFLSFLLISLLVYLFDFWCLRKTDVAFYGSTVTVSSQTLNLQELSSGHKEGGLA